MKDEERMEGLRKDGVLTGMAVNILLGEGVGGYVERGGWMDRS